MRTGCRVGSRLCQSTGSTKPRTRPGGGRCAHGDMGHVVNVRAQEFGRPNILDDIVVVADEYPAFPAMEVKHAVNLGCQGVEDGRLMEGAASGIWPQGRSCRRRHRP